MSVLPFGATHTHSAEVLSTMVQPRLTKNQRLKRELAQGMRTRFISNDGGATWEKQLSLPLKGETLQRLFQMITRGLVYAHFDILLPETECVVFADYMGSAGRTLFDQLFTKRGNRVSQNLGNGIFAYEMVQSFDPSQLTATRMSLCGGVVGGDPKAPDEKASVVYAVTAPRRMSAASELVRMLRAEQQKLGVTSE